MRDDVVGDLPTVPVAEAYAASRFRESRDPEGGFSLVADHAARLQVLKALPLWDVRAARETTVAEVYGID